MTDSMLTRMAIASHNFFRLKYTLLPPWDELPPEAQATGVEHAKALLGAMDPMTDAMNDVWWDQEPSERTPEFLWPRLLAAAAAGK